MNLKNKDEYEAGKVGRVHPWTCWHFGYTASLPVAKDYKFQECGPQMVFVDQSKIVILVVIKQPTAKSLTTCLSLLKIIVQTKSVRPLGCSPDVAWFTVYAPRLQKHKHQKTSLEKELPAFQFKGNPFVWCMSVTETSHILPQGKVIHALSFLLIKPTTEIQSCCHHVPWAISTDSVKASEDFNFGDLSHVWARFTEM